MIATDRLGSITTEPGTEPWSGQRLGDEILRRAGRLHAAGVGPSDRVVIAHGGSAGFFADLLATWHVGACACCLSPTLAAEEFDRLCAFVRPRLVLRANPLQASATPANFATACLGDDTNDGAGPANPVPQAGWHPDHDALVLFTSGTTGTPKGVVHTFRGLFARLTLNRAFIPEGERRVTLCTLPTHFGHGLIGNCLTPLLDGGDLVLADPATLATGRSLGPLIDRHGVTFLSSVPALWRAALDGDRPRSATLRRVHIGSAPLSADLWRSIIEWSGTRNVVNLYGITETANWICGASAAEFEPADGLVGRMWGGVAAVRTADGDLRATGEGELCVSTPSLMRGYLDRDDETRRVMTGPWYRTGDAGAIDARGVVRITGREALAINHGGMKIYPEDIDLLLERHPDVAEACAFPVPDPIAGESVGAAVCAVPGSAIDLPALRAWCAERLAAEKQPRSWFIVPGIPRNDRGKIDRRRVAADCLASGQPEATGAGDAGTLVAAVLRLPPGSIDADAAMGTFPGWDSLATVAMIQRVERDLGRRLQGRELAAARSLRGLEGLLGGHPDDVTAPMPDPASVARFTDALHRAGLTRLPIVHVLISSSGCAPLGLTDPDMLVNALLEAAGPDTTVIMGSFTWAFARGTPYHHRDSTTELGLVNEAFRRHPRARRSAHPMYSYAGIGPRAEDVLRQETNDSWGPGSVTRRLLHSGDTRTICLGLGEVRGSRLVGSTGLHALEQEFGVDYRFLKTFQGTADFGEGAGPYTATMYVRHPERCAASSWAPADSALRRMPSFHASGDGLVYAYDNADLLAVGRSLLDGERHVFRVPPGEDRP